MIFISHTDILDGKAVLLEIAGRLDSASSPDFEDYINDIISRNIRFIIFDAKKLEFVTSEGIGVLILIQKKVVMKNGFFVIINMSNEIKTLFSLLGFDKIFTFNDSRIEAMQLIDRQMELRENDTENISMKNEVNTSDEIKAEEKKYEKPSDMEIPVTVSAAFPSPVIIECIKCRSLIRIKEPGDYLCSECSERFSVDEDQIIKFS
jgi:anti-anti-sigma factor